MSDLPSSVVLQDQLIGMAVGSYRIESLVGAGGMGLVYRARHELIDRCFAIKVLRPEVADDVAMVKSFLTEAQTLSAIKHPNIIDIVGFGLLPDGRQYMVMEYLEGHTLEQELAAGRLSLERVLFVGEQILCALHAAHSVEVIHRDLKPSNVFIAKGSGGSEVIKLLDFGLSRYQPVAFSSGTGAPAVSMVAGTPEYVSPEQAIGSAPDTASDLYSFGAMLFELVTGRLPFEPGLELPNRVGALLYAHATERAPSTGQFDATVPTALGELVAQLLEKKPSARPASAEEVRQRLENLRRDLAAVRPIQLVVRSPESIARLAMPPRRWRAAAALTALMVFVPLAILLGSGSGSAAATPQLNQVPAAAPVEVAELPPTPVEEIPEVLAPVPASVEPVALPRRTRARPPPPVTTHSECTPDARWRAAALSNLQELQQLAAQDHWAEFERLEPALANAVSSASTGTQCEAVERQIRKLARAWRP